MNLDFSDLRTPYKCFSEAFLESDLSSLDPLEQFVNWFEDARNCQDITEPNAMCLATATKDGLPSCRMVLLKKFHNGGFEFFTNYNSRKGKELAENPRASICIYWEPLKRSIRIEGFVEKLPESVSKSYFHIRPRDSQIGATISSQSQPIPNRDFLQEKEKEMKEIYGNDKEIPKPDEWGGYMVIPEKIEFWQGQSTRIHDRFSFRRFKEGEDIDETVTKKGINGWIYERLAP